MVAVPTLDAFDPLADESLYAGKAADYTTGGGST
jgi:hypothetical protein